MWELFVIGFMAGLALAIPVGPMAIILINTTISRGLRHGVVGALGMATVDAAYALAVFVIGGLIAASLASLKLLFGLIGAAILLVIGVQTAYKNVQLLKITGDLEGKIVDDGSIAQTFGTFVAATVVNAPTALYFLAIAPNVANMGYQVSALNVSVFVISVFLGSLIWQESLVFTGMAIRGVTTNRFRAWIGLVGGILIVALAISIGLRAF
ncbi:MAG: LysE family translocator [Micrococcales bacterium]